MNFTKKRKFLYVDESVAIIKLLESGKSSRNVAEQFGISRTQIQVHYAGREQGKIRGWGGALQGKVDHTCNRR